MGDALDRRSGAGADAPEASGADPTMPPLTLENYGILLPSITGLAMASTASNIIVQQAHATTGISTFGGWAMVAACIPVGALFIATLVVKRFSKRAISLSVFLSIHLAGLSALALAFADLTQASFPTAAELLFQGAIALGAVIVQFYWLRKLRGTSAQAVVMVVFSALAVSELLTFICSLAPLPARLAFSVALMFMQFAAVNRSRKLGVPSDQFPAVSESYFGTDENRFSNRSFLAVAAMGVWFISIPLGMGRGFPAGPAIYLDVLPRGLVLVCVCVVSALWVRFALASRMRALTTSIWVMMQLLLGAGAICFAAWPVNASMGGAFFMAAALVLQAFIWYMTVAFTSFGWRDPYYYASAAWLAMNLLAILGMRVDSLLTAMFPTNTGVIIAIMSFFVLIGAQVVFTRLLASPSEEQAAAQAAAQATSGAGTEGTPTEEVHHEPLMGMLAISPQENVSMSSKTPDVHIAQSVMEMGRLFGLTGREVEVLTLYALGHTQARVSEELQLSTNTVHTHIKRIYEKTDLHSRQEILDYITKYGR